MISWLRVSIWRCVAKPVLATAGADYARHWRGYIASLCAPRALVAAPAPTAGERWARCGS